MTPSGFAYAMAARDALARPSSSRSPTPLQPRRAAAAAGRRAAGGVAGGERARTWSCSPTARTTRRTGSTSARPSCSGCRWSTPEDLAPGRRPAAPRRARRRRRLPPLQRRPAGHGRRAAAGAAIEAGTLGVVNAFGCGVGDDKLAHAYVDDIVRFYLGEEPRLRSVETLDLGRPDPLERALDTLRRAGDQAALRQRRPRRDGLPARRPGRRRGAARDRVQASPRELVAQPLVELSRHPTVVDGVLCHVMSTCDRSCSCTAPTTRACCPAGSPGSRSTRGRWWSTDPGRRLQGHMGARPLIGVTTSEVRLPRARTRCPRATRRSTRWRSASSTPARWSARAGSRSCCRRSRRGGRPLVDRLAGICLSGGPDLDPAAYGADPPPQLGPIEPRLDAFELAVARAADALGLPILGICRGCQALNVARGGTLHQHLPDVTDGSVPTARPSRAGRRRTRSKSAGSQLAAILGARARRELVPPPGRRPARPRPARGRVGARRRDRGDRGRRAALYLGVQWHAETLVRARARGCSPRWSGGGDATHARGLTVCGFGVEMRPDGRPTATRSSAWARRSPRAARTARPVAGRRRRAGPPAAGDHRPVRARRAADARRALGLAVVFNGCIYNHHELRGRAGGLGHRFRSTSDTEVLLKGWASGARAARPVRGDVRVLPGRGAAGRVVLARDRLGVKPLYLAECAAAGCAPRPRSRRSCAPAASTRPSTRWRCTTT